MNEKNGSGNLIAAVLVMLLIGFLFYVFNYLTPLYADDYTYSFSFLDGERIVSVQQIIGSQIGHYLNMNGRSITHTLAQLFLLAGDSAFNFTNTLFFLALIVLINYHADGSFKHLSATKLVMTAALLFLSCPEFGQSFLWITGAANYLYGILIVLCVLLPYRRQAAGQSSSYSPFFEVITAVVYLALGIVAGWTNENTSVALIVMIAGYLVLFRINSIRIHAWSITGGVGAIIGCALMLLAPGTIKRLNSVGGSGGIIMWPKRFIFYSCDMILNLQLGILLFVLLFILFVYQRQITPNKGSIKEVVRTVPECGITAIYLLGFLISVYSMIAAPYFPGRVWSGPVVLFLISLLSLCSVVDLSDYKTRLGKNIAVGFTVIICAVTYLNAYLELKNIDSAYHERVSIINSALSSHEESVEIPPICGWSGYSCYTAQGDLNEDSSEWPNKAIAKYYGVGEIVCAD